MTRYYWYTQREILANAAQSTLSALCARLFEKHIGQISAAQVVFEIAQTSTWSEHDAARDAAMLNALVSEAIHHGLSTTDRVISPVSRGSLINEIAELTVMEATMSVSAAALYERLLAIESVEEQSSFELQFLND